MVYIDEIYTTYGLYRLSFIHCLAVPTGVYPVGGTVIDCFSCISSFFLYLAWILVAASCMILTRVLLLVI